jgi:HTH-type transcriptional regulator / antitoxin HigA
VLNIEFVLEARGLTRKDLQPFTGTRQRVWDIMEKRRRLTLPMIRSLANGLNLPTDILVPEYVLLPKRNQSDDGTTGLHPDVLD